MALCCEVAMAACSWAVGVRPWVSTHSRKCSGTSRCGIWWACAVSRRLAASVDLPVLSPPRSSMTTGCKSLTRSSGFAVGDGLFVGLCVLHEDLVVLQHAALFARVGFDDLKTLLQVAHLVGNLLVTPFEFSVLYF